MSQAAELPKKVETVVIGGGVIGTSVAYHLAKKGREVLLLERDDIASKASSKALGYLSHIGHDETMLKLCGHGWSIWHEFNEQGDIDLHFYPVMCPIYENTPEEIKEMLLLVPVASKKFFGENSKDAGRYVPREELLELVPTLSKDEIVIKGVNLGKIEGAIFGPETDAYVDPYLLTMAYAKHARALGADLRTKVEVTGIKLEAGAVKGVETAAGSVECKYVVNAAGAWASRIGEMVGIKVPAKPVRRVSLTIKSKQEKTKDLGVMITDEAEALTDRQGIAFRDDEKGYVGMGNHGTTGEGEDPVDPDDINPNYTQEDVLYFAEKLEQFFPDFGDFEIVDGWGSQYGAVYDANYIIDKVEGIEGFILCCGFSGSGLTASAGAGLMASELIIDGKISYIKETGHYAYNTERFPELKQS